MWPWAQPVLYIQNDLCFWEMSADAPQTKIYLLISTFWEDDNRLTDWNTSLHLLGKWLNKPWWCTRDPKGRFFFSKTKKSTVMHKCVVTCQKDRLKEQYCSWSYSDKRSKYSVVTNVLSAIVQVSQLHILRINAVKNTGTLHHKWKWWEEWWSNIK